MISSPGAVPCYGGEKFLSVASHASKREYVNSPYLEEPVVTLLMA